MRSDDEPRSQAEAVLSEALLRLERDRDAFDLDAFLAAHPEEASEVRRRFAALETRGFLGGCGEPPRAVGSLEERYELRGELGRGGMGVVHRAYDRDVGRDVALKVVRPRAGAPEHALLLRFLAEARITGSLEHPGIVPLHDVGVLRDGATYYTMRLVEGSTLEDVVAEGGEEGSARRGASWIARTLLEICNALRFAHARGVLHRDLTPRNVMVGAFGEVYVLDWGLAKRLGTDDAGAGGDDGGESGAVTVPGHQLGTPGFRAPEQERGALEEIDQRTDVYGVGALLFHQLFGRAPGRHPVDVDGAVPDRDHAVPPELRAICGRALRLDPVDRYPTVAALADDLAAYLEDRPGRAWRDSWAVRLAKAARRRPAAATALLALVIGGVGAWVASLRIDLHRARAAGLEAARADDEMRARIAAVEARVPRAIGRSGHGRRSLQAAAVVEDAWSQVRWYAEQHGASLPEGADGETVARLLDRVLTHRPAMRRPVVRFLHEIAFQFETSPLVHYALNLEEGRGGPLPTGVSPVTLARRRVVRTALTALESDAWFLSVWHALDLHQARGRRGEDSGTFTALLPPDAGTPRTVEQREWLGRVAAATGDDAAARAQFDAVLAETWSSFWAHFHVARLEFRDATRPRAPTETRSTLAGLFLPGEPRDGEVSDPRALDRAIDHGSASVALLEESAAAWGNHAAYLACLVERRDEALDAARRAVALDPDHGTAQWAVGRLLLEAGRPEEAIAFLRRATELEPDDGEIAADHEEALRRSGRRRDNEARGVRRAPSDG